MKSSPATHLDEKAVVMGWRRMLAAAIAVAGTLVVAPAATAAVPVVTVSLPAEVEPNGATLLGSVDPSLFETTYHFQWDAVGSDFCDMGAAPAHTEDDVVLPGYMGKTSVTQWIDGLVPEASYCFRIVATNASGTTTTNRLSFQTPAKPPETVLFSKPAGLVTSRTVSMGFNSSAEDALFECSLDDGAFTECESPMELTQLADGEHVFAVRAVDLRTHLADETPATSEFRVAASSGGGSTGGGTPGGGTTGGGTSGGTVVTGPAPVPAAPKVGRSGRAKLNGARLATGQKVSCAGAGDVCRVTVKLLATAKGSKKLVKVGSTRSTVAAGATSAITVKLNAKGRKLLKKAGKLKVISTVTVKRGARIPVTAGLKFNVKRAR